MPDALSLPPLGGEVSSRSDHGVGEAASSGRSRRRPGTTSRARNLRQGDNQAEALLWVELKRRKLGGHKFTRQFPVGPYFADFCCREKMLVIELGGSQHADCAHDVRRDAYLNERGYSILRFWNHEVLKHRTAARDTILATLNGNLPATSRTGELRFLPAAPLNRPLAHPAGVHP